MINKSKPQAGGRKATHPVICLNNFLTFIFPSQLSQLNPSQRTCGGDTLYIWSLAGRTPAILAEHFSKRPWLCHPSSLTSPFRLRVSVPCRNRGGRGRGGDIPCRKQHRPTPARAAVPPSCGSRGSRPVSPGEPQPRHVHELFPGGQRKQ